MSERVLQWAMVVRDFDCVAYWLPTIEGRAANLDEPTGVSQPARGRGEFVDDHHFGLRRAFAVLGRLRRLRDQPGGGARAEVLQFTFVECGEEYRKRADPRDTGEGVARMVAERFAPPELHLRWRSVQRSMRKILMQRYGETLLDDAVAAWVQLAGSNDDGR